MTLFPMKNILLIPLLVLLLWADWKYGDKR